MDSESLSRLCSLERLCGAYHKRYFFYLSISCHCNKLHASEPTSNIIYPVTLASDISRYRGKSSEAKGGGGLQKPLVNNR